MSKKLFLLAATIAACLSMATAQDYIGDGNAHLNGRRYDQAVDQYTKAIAKQGKSTIAHYNRALAYMMMNRSDLALADLEVVLQMDPRNADALIQRSHLYNQRDQHVAAMTDLNTALTIDSMNPYVYYNRAQMYSRQQRLQEAIEDYNRSISLKPDVQSYIGRATARLNANEPRMALSDAEYALAIDSMNALAWLSRGEAYMAMNVADSAMWAWRRSAVIDPQSSYMSYINSQLAVMSADEMGMRDSVFTDAGRQIALTLPRSWHSASTDDGSTITLRVARQPIRSATDTYAEGVTVKYHRKAGQFTNARNPTPQLILQSWKASNLASSRSLHTYNVVRSEPITVTGWSGELREIAVQPTNNSYRIHQYEGVFSRLDELVTVVAEVAEPLWSVYHQRLVNAIRTIKLPVKGY